MNYSSLMKPRCRSVFENYEHFEAWEDSSEHNCPNLLQRLNTNLNLYENKYKKYMNFQENDLKNSKKLQPLLPPLEKHQENTKILPFIKSEIEQTEKTQNLNSQKVFISEEKELKDSDIFCERTNLLLKHKTLCFEKNSKQGSFVKRRKLSGNDQKYPEIEKILIQSKKQQEEEKENLTESKAIKKCAEGYKKLRYRLKKAANKSKLYHEEIYNEPGEKENEENLFLKKRLRKIREEISKNTEEPFDEKSNEFSDKNFYEPNKNLKYALQR